jgi:starch-binding outer membrane protein, SusD/RagB family
MSNFKVITTTIVTGIVITIFCSCKKIGFLNEKTSSDLYVPGTLDELQYLFNDENTMNRWGCELGETSSDNYYLSYDSWINLQATLRNAYRWAPEIYENDKVCDDWLLSSKQILNANVVLAGLQQIGSAGNQWQWNNLKGKALFFRSCAFFNMAQEFAALYDSTTAEKDLGIPLRLTGNIDDNPGRSSVKQTYDQIVNNLKEAAQLMGRLDPSNLNQPSREAALAMLARVYLSLNMYTQAGIYADSCLQLYNALINYNSLPLSSNAPFSTPNREIIFKAELPEKSDALRALSTMSCIVDSILYSSYAPDDLRQKVLFITMRDSLPHPKKGYTRSVIPFCGLATDEMLLIRAECRARSGNFADAMFDLNTLLDNRYKEGAFTHLTANSKDQALQYIITERRKELPFRGLRWTDLRRLNKVGLATTLTRRLKDSTFQLQPNDRLYVLPIPKEIILFSGIEQNQR